MDVQRSQSGAQVLELDHIISISATNQTYFFIPKKNRVVVKLPVFLLPADKFFYNERL